MSRPIPNSKRSGLRRVIRRLTAGEDGAALVEFTILAPMLVVASIYTMDFGLYFYNKMELQNAAQAGAQWAIANRVFNSADIATATKNATTFSASNITVTSVQFCGCPSTTGVTQISTGACPGGTTCADGSTTGTYVTITATPTTAYHSFIPYGLIASTYDLTAQSTARIQ
jgi:Flp pilus assembly protein TadG